MVKINMNQQRKLSRHNSRQSSIGETASVGSAKSGKSSGSGDYNSLSSSSTTTGQQQGATKSSKSKHGIQESGNGGTQPTASILNVAEMVLHGVADKEILDTWLREIQCEEFVAKFIDAGYDMPTISRITPQDLTAIGVTEPTKRLKILTEIKKLNLQDGIPNFRPASLSHWLSLIRLDSYYYESLCDQKVDTIEKMCQLTWEDFEELGITKLGHQKRFQLAIERVKELEAEAKSSSSKPMSEPIYDTNPSQILLVASAENHSMNGPIINKQSSTSELSSTGSGSMHSVYSSASTHYQPTYAPLPDNQQSSIIVSQMPNGNHNQQQQQQHQNHQQQAIYSQPPPPTLMYQQPPPPPPMAPSSMQQQSHYQPVQQQQHPMQTTPPSQFVGSAMTVTNNAIGMNGMISQQQNRQSISQLPFSALANLPKHQQQLLQQSSIYATLSRQPSKAKQPPPPVPIRTNSLTSNSLTDNANNKQQQQQTNYQSSQMNNCHTTSTSSLFRSGTRVANNNRNSQFNSQTMLTKNKSFSGNAHMEASRARFLNRNSKQQQQFSHLPHQFQTIMNNNSGINCSNQNFIYGLHSDRITGASLLNGTHLTNDIDSGLFRQLAPNNNQHSEQQPQQQQPSLPKSQVTTTSSNNREAPVPHHRDDFDIHSDTNSTKSLFIPSSSMITSPIDNNNQQLLNSPSTHNSGSSQTLYNSVSSGSNDQSLNMYNFSQSGDLIHRFAATTASSCTLNDASLILDRQQHQQTQPQQQCSTNSSSSSNSNFSSVARNLASAHCNATTGKDDDFPPPPSPLSLTDSDEHDLVSLNLDNNFTDVCHGLMTFRVGI